MVAPYKQLWLGNEGQWISFHCSCWMCSQLEGWASLPYCCVYLKYVYEGTYLQTVSYVFCVVLFFTCLYNPWSWLGLEVWIWIDGCMDGCLLKECSIEFAAATVQLKVKHTIKGLWSPSIYFSCNWKKNCLCVRKVSNVHSITVLFTAH